MIRAAGAREVHLRLGSPPITGPCHYGIDTPTREELIASTHSIEEIREFLGVDSLGYLSLDGMLRAAGSRQRLLSRLLLRPVSHPDSGGSGAAAARVPAHRHARMSGPYTQPLVYFFGQGRADGTAAMKDILGGKGAGLAEMTTIGIPVPPGFTIASSLCLHYLESQQFPKRLRVEVENTPPAPGGGHREALRRRGESAARLGALGRGGLDAGHDGDDPQPRAQRRHGRGTRAARAATPRFAWDSYRRFVQMYGSVVFDLSKQPFEQLLEEQRQRCGVERDIDLPLEDVQALVRRVQGAHPRRRPAASSPTTRCASSGARSRRCSRAGTPAARSTTGSCTTSPTRMGTAVNVVAMVFGNLGEDSGTGVAFSRDPSTGERALYGEFLLNAQGEDVVSGSRTPLPIAALREKLPHAYQELERVARTLERHFRDVQDMEFTIERGMLYMLQTRRGQRSGQAAVRIACDMVDEGLISEEEAVARIPPNDLEPAAPPDDRSHQQARPAHDRPAGAARAPPAAPRCSTPTAPRRWAAPDRRRSWCGGRPRPRTSTAW